RHHPLEARRPGHRAGDGAGPAAGRGTAGGGTMRRPVVLLLGILLAPLALALVPAPAAAQEVNVAPLEFRDADEAERFQSLALELRCVKCQNQSLADSDAAIAHDLRNEVLGLMRRGMSDQEIKD